MKNTATGMHFRGQDCIKEAQASWVSKKRALGDGVFRAQQTEKQKVSMARRGVRDKIICLIAGPGQNLFSFKMGSISEHTKNIALLLKKFLLLRWPLSIEDR